MVDFCIVEYHGARLWNENRHTCSYMPLLIAIALYVLSSITCFPSIIHSTCSALLQNARINANPTMETPNTVVSENPISHKITHYITPRVAEALRSAFAYQLQHNQTQGRTPVTVDVGEGAHYVDGHIPDLAIYRASWNYASGQKPANRAPGDVKPSWKWRHNMVKGNQNQQREFRQVISQVRRYMGDNGSRYGFVITNEELVALRRDDNSGQFK